MDPPKNPSFLLPDHLHGSSGVQNLAAADLSLQLDLARPQNPQLNRLEFNGQWVTAWLQLDQPQQSAANSESSVNQPRETQLSPDTSSDISQFRELLRKVTYNIESSSDDEGVEATSCTAVMDERRKIDDKSAVHEMVVESLLMVDTLLTRSNSKRIFGLDLNLTPCENDMFF